MGMDELTDLHEFTYRCFPTEEYGAATKFFLFLKSALLCFLNPTEIGQF